MPYKDPEKERERNRKRYAENIEKERERARLKSHRDVLAGKSKERKRKWRIEHPEEYKASQVAYRKTESGKEGVRRHNRKQGLRIQGWTVEAYDAVLLAQDGLCAICKVKLTSGNRADPNKAAADHEHTEPPKPRGILCSLCNSGLGFFKDLPHLLEAAAEYLRKYGKQ